MFYLFLSHSLINPLFSMSADQHTQWATINVINERLILWMQHLTYSSFILILNYCLTVFRNIVIQEIATFWKVFV